MNEKISEVLALAEMAETMFPTKNRYTYRKKQKKIGRNDTCHCGSGKKYKNCCI